MSADDRDWLISAYHWVLTSYVPKRYRGRVSLFLTDETIEQTPFVPKQWRKAAPQTRIERIPGRHLSCITTHLAAVAEKLRAEIDAVRSLMAMLLPAVGSQLLMLDS
jgi:thioesterase domain-containing protein